MLEFDEHTPPWSPSIVSWLKVFVRKIVIDNIDEQAANCRGLKTYFCVAELRTELIRGEELSRRTVLNYINEGNIQPLGYGPNNRHMYSIQQFEDLWIRRAQEKIVSSRESSPRSITNQSGGMGRVLARMKKEKVA